MKKQSLISLLLVVVISLGAFAQNKVCDKVFNQYAGKKGFMSVNVPDFPSNKKGEYVVSSFKALYVEDSILNKNLNFYNEIVPNLNKKEYEELMSVKEDKEGFAILFKKKNKKITEFIIVCGGTNNALIYCSGSMSEDEMNEITKSQLEKLKK